LEAWVKLSDKDPVIAERAQIKTWSEVTQTYLNELYR
jgi:hypothetical protein